MPFWPEPDRYASLVRPPRRGFQPGNAAHAGPVSVYAVLLSEDAPLLLRKGQLLVTLRPALLHPNPAQPANPRRGQKLPWCKPSHRCRSPLQLVIWQRSKSDLCR